MNLSRETKDHTLLVRYGIAEALSSATQPMTLPQIAAHPAVASLGVSNTLVSNTIVGMFKNRQLRHTIAKTIATGGERNTRWAYYDPRITAVAAKVAAAAKPAEKPAEKPAIVTGSACDFTFNPVEFDTPPTHPPTQGADASFEVPKNAKAVTISIGGVTVRIDLTE